MTALYCTECGREVSAEVHACVSCGDSVLRSGEPVHVVTHPVKITYDAAHRFFVGSRTLTVRLAKQAIGDLGLHFEDADDSMCPTTGQTYVRWRSATGVGGCLDVGPARGPGFSVSYASKYVTPEGYLPSAEETHEKDDHAGAVVARMVELAGAGTPQ